MTPQGDAALCLGAALAVVGLSLLEGTPLPLPALIAASLAVSVPLALRRRFPVTTAVVCAGVVAVVALPDWPGRLVTMGAFVSAAYHRPTALVLPLSVAWLLLLATAGTRPPGAAALTDLILLGVAPAAVGRALRQAERLRREQTRRVLAEHQSRTAREVHDAVGHHLTAIHLQAEAVRRVTPDLPPAAAQALTTIAESSATALAEIRDVLRQHTATLADLPALAARAGATLTHDNPRPLPPDVDHAAYRIAQEAVTNALRHSDATAIHVHVHHKPSEVTITVADNGSTTPTAELPRTLRDRVRELGGTLRVTPNDPTGWRVEAGLPT